MSQHPTAQAAAGHIPADLLRQLPAGTDPRQVVIVQAPPRSYAGQALVILAAAGGTALVVAMIAVTIHIAAAAAAAVPVTVGLGGAALKLGGRK
jgi:predicted phage tail protein